MCRWFDPGPSHHFLKSISLLKKGTNFYFKKIEVSINDSNFSQLKLFKKLSFKVASQEDELKKYEYFKKYRTNKKMI